MYAEESQFTGDPGLRLDAEGRVTACPQMLMQCLRSITAAMATQPELRSLLHSTVLHGRCLAISSVAVWRVEGDELVLSGAAGYSDGTLDRFLRLPLTANVPCSDAVSQERGVLCADRSVLFAMYPLLERIVQRTQALISMPLVDDGAAKGAISFHFSVPVRVDEPLVVFLTTISDLAMTMQSYHDTDLAEVLPLTLVARPQELDTLEPVGTVEERLEALERQMRKMRQLMMFLGAIANERFDEVP